MAGTETVIRKVTENVWTFSRPFARYGFIPFGGRSTAIKLSDGVWVMASTTLDSETKRTIDGLGEVKYIVTGDGGHYLFLREFKDAYPQAKVIGVSPLLGKPEVPKLDGVYGNDPPGTKYGYEDEIEACYFPGFRNIDVAFFHKASRTLIEADLLLNLPAKEQYSKAPRPFFQSLYDFINPYNAAYRRIIKSLNPGKDDTKRDARTVMSWDFDRIIPCHGEIIESNGKAAWASAYADFLN